LENPTFSIDHVQKQVMKQPEVSFIASVEAV